jgi:sec-independent protein translocase protein TatA
MIWPPTQTAPIAATVRRESVEADTVVRLDREAFVVWLFCAAETVRGSPSLSRSLWPGWGIRELIFASVILSEVVVLRSSTTTQSKDPYKRVESKGDSMFEGLFQPMHLLVIAGIALLVLGPKKLPELGKGLGESIRGFKSAMAAKEDETKPTPKEAKEGTPS